MAAVLSGALARRHHVTVLAGRPSYDPTERHKPYLFRREISEGLVVERVGSTTWHRARLAGRVCNYLSYLALAVPRALMHDADVVLAMTDPPIAGIAGALVARVRRKPFIYSVQDLYPDMAVGAGFLREGGGVATAWERLHRWAMRSADRVIVLGEDMAARVMTKGVERSRVSVVRSGATIPPDLPDPDHPVAQEVRCGYPFVVMHAGNLGFYGAWETLIRAAELLRGSGASFVFVGAGAAALRLRTLAASTNGRVRFLPFRPASEIPYVIAAGDLHLVTVRRGLEGVVVPSKLYGILAAGRPVLAVTTDESDVARIIRRYGCGLVADPDDPVAVAKAVREAMASPEALAQMGKRARAAAAEFGEERQVERFAEIVEETLHAVRPGGTRGG